MKKSHQKVKIKTWTKLDNAGKIFPPTTTKSDTKVFRLSCEFDESVDPEILQQALNKTTKAYPLFQSVLKKGMFWYYLEASSITPKVQIECKPPCSPLYIHNKKSLLFEVTYFQNRVNLEVYHAISDGTGAGEFLKTLVTHYFVLRYPDEYEGVHGLFKSISSTSQQNDDSFNRYFSKEDMPRSSKSVKAHTIKLPIISENRISVIECSIPLDKIIAIAKEMNTTITILLSAIFLISVSKDMTLKERSRPVVSVVPVNLRNYFESESVRNFFGTINVGYTFSNTKTKLADVVESLKQSFATELTPKSLNERMNRYSALEHNIFARPVPLFIKDWIMYIANRIGEGEKTVSISNIGKVTMPPEIAVHIESFNLFVSTKIIQMCLCSFKDQLNLTFSAAYVDTNIQMHFVRYLTSLGIPVTINSNLLEEETAE